MILIFFVILFHIFPHILQYSCTSFINRTNTTVRKIPPSVLQLLHTCIFHCNPLYTRTHSYSPNIIIIISHLGPTNPSTQKSFPLLLHWRISSTYLLVKYNLYLTLGNPKRAPPITTSLVELQAHATVPHSWLDLHKRASGWHALGMPDWHLSVQYLPSLSFLKCAWSTDSTLSL